MIKGELDTREFKKVFEEYMKFAKKAPSEVINSKCFFIARNATFTTTAADKNKIREELNAPSEKNADIPLAAILVNKQFHFNKKHHFIQ